MSSSMLWPVAYASSVVSPDDAKFFIFGGNDDGTVRQDSQVVQCVQKIEHDYEFNVFF